MAKKEINSDISVDGQIMLTNVPDGTGNFLTYNLVNKAISQRTNAEVISDLGLITASNIASAYYNKTESDAKFVPYTGANKDINLNKQKITSVGTINHDANVREVVNIGRFNDVITINGESFLTNQSQYWNGTAFITTKAYHLGLLAGYNNVGNNIFSAGDSANRYNIGNNVYSIGTLAGYGNGGGEVINLGTNSGRLNRNSYATHIGSGAGQFSAAAHIINIGLSTGGYTVSNTSAFLGYNCGYYTQGSNNIAIGNNSNATFKSNTAGNKTFDYTAIDTTAKTITIPSHGFGIAGAYVNLLFTQGTSAITGISNGNVIQVKIVDTNTLLYSELLTSGQYRYTNNITSAGTGTGHIFTPQFVYNNTIIFGSSLEPTKSNQNIISGGEFLMPQSTVGTIDADTTNKALITKEWFNSKIASYATLAGTQTFTGTNTFNSSPVVPSPTLGTHAVNKNYVDNNFKIKSSKYYNSTNIDNNTFTSAWVTIANVQDSSNTPVLFAVRAYAHTSVLFSVIKSYSTAGNITVLNYNGISNDSFRTVKGVRLLGDGSVQIRLAGNTNGNIQLTVNTFGSSDNVTLVSSLTVYTGTPSIINEFDNLESGKFVTSTGYKVNGGLSTGFLKADGSVDNTVYITNNQLASYVTINTDQFNISGQKQFNTSFASYTPEGLFDAISKPLIITTPSGNATLIGYRDFGTNQYYPRIGFRVNGSPSNWSIGPQGNDFVLNTNNNGHELIKFQPDSNIITQNFGNANEWKAAYDWIQTGASQSWVISQGYITANDVPPVYNGRINYTGVGAIEGGGASTANQSVNTHYSFDLTQATKNNINNGVTAYGWGDHSSAGYVKVSGDFIHDGTVSDYDLSTDGDTYLHNISIESSNGLNVLNLSNRHTLTIRNSNSASCPIKINSGSTFSINGYSTYVFYMTDAGKIIVTELVTTSEYT